MPYERIDFDKLKEEFAGLEQDLSNASTGDEAFRVHERFYKVFNHVMSESQIAMIHSDIDMSDEKWLAEQQFFDEHMPIFENLVVSYKRSYMRARIAGCLKRRSGRSRSKTLSLR